MTKVIIVGASGSLALVVVEALKKLKNASLTLFVRNKKRLPAKIAEGCAVIEGDAMQYQSIKAAVTSQDIVYINLAGNLDAMAKNIVQAMKETGVKRVIAISSIGIYDVPLRPVLVTYRKLADVIEDSGLSYTILRPNWFTSTNEIDYTITFKGEHETGTAVSRKSIADFVATIVAEPELYSNKNVGISKPD